ncbi:methyltransferase domain-containing protein [Paenibacillus macquariensis]|uniref:Methyltransferase domain-containing protein n=1 Tax=Paenibacillus macquariensis TaxID=948756 RepID=A0ABY1JZ39_9BACL|nr:methyltransferase domain-containing protein [Paenibacillus macquariensis]MEC0091234.1 methyltransferase domain-containing protein [Paenibacillus macquariensis]OAB37932.1 stilbene synthase [Paenibacillus macquariensis subsp. macquariensis]SIR02415.1 Methyltransferase domain-containing protein [Paenibacillus macquariensis]
MSILKKLRRRAEEPELMDDFSMGGEELHEALRDLRLLNRIFAASSPTVYGVEQLWILAGRTKHLSILDVGAGSGDVNRHLLKWADKKGIDITIHLADVTEEACEEARQFFHDEPRVTVRFVDVLELPEASVDIVTASQFIHHFTGDELHRIVTHMHKVSKLGVVINDIHRQWIPWLAVWFVSRVVSTNRYIRHDGPLSVAKGFRATDWITLREALEIPQLRYSWRPLFRYAVVIPQHASDSEEGSVN